MSTNTIDAAWLPRCGRPAVPTILQEYRYLVHRFPQWLALVIGRSEHQRVWQWLLPNLVEECGSLDGEPSHLALLDRTLASCGVTGMEQYHATDETRAAENWFYGVFAERDTYESLCVLGPGTEAISQTFLQPLEECLRRELGGDNLDLEYFAAHRTEVEAQHAEHIEAAIQYLEEQAETEVREKMHAARATWTQAGIDAHAKFWADLHAQLRSKGLLTAGAQ